MNKIKIIQRIMTSVLMGTLIVVCICGCGSKTASFIESEENETNEEMTVIETQQSSDVTEDGGEVICVYVCGSIQNPGVYTLPQGSRICELFEIAGGFTDVAAEDYWNQARVLTDGEMIYVPTEEEAGERVIGANELSGTSTTYDDGKININTATKDELMTLPGIGESKAVAIISYRDSNGGFSSIEDVMNVEGIKDGVFAKIEDYIKVN